MNNIEEDDLDAIKAIKSTPVTDNESNTFDSFGDKGLSGERSLLHLEFELKERVTHYDLRHKTIELVIKMFLVAFTMSVVVFLLKQLSSTLCFIKEESVKHNQPLDDSKLIVKVFLYSVIGTFISIFSLIAVLIKSFTTKSCQSTPIKEEIPLTPTAVLELINNVLKNK